MTYKQYLSKITLGFPWQSRVYLSQCYTFSIAKEITGRSGDAVPYPLHLEPPYCLRVLPAYRTPEIRAFRDTVARQARLSRK